MKKAFIGVLRRVLEVQEMLWQVELGEVFQVERTLSNRQEKRRLEKRPVIWFAYICHVYVGE